MNSKLKTITENIHESVFLSNLEYDLISTPYFYRLHDIYQSSTVYMTFPANRTKRYEHSIGTMDIASKLFFSAISNADSENCINILFSDLKEFSKVVLEAVLDSNIKTLPGYLPSETVLDTIFNGFKKKNTIDIFDQINEEYVEKAFKEGFFEDIALDHYQYLPLERKSKDKKEQPCVNIGYLFLYKILLQAIRIVALFHDIGHPPYSHIIEDVLKDLYIEVNNNDEKYNADKRNEFINIMRPYCAEKGIDDEGIYKTSSIMVNSVVDEAEMHERISVRLLEAAFASVIPDNISRINVDDNISAVKISGVIYNTLVVEFALAIVTNYNDTFHSMHKLVDGFIDADRLDYVVRDSINSGVDWGRIPYKRVIESAKLFLVNNENNEVEHNFVLAFPNKLSNELCDILLLRYKIFSRINFHHRCMKTAVALQSAIKELAIDYLENEDDNCISQEISKLWMALSMEIGDKNLRIIQWNDSWLITTLNNALIELSSRDDKKNYRNLIEDLSEILLNKKRYFSLLKRGEDSKKFVKKIFDEAGINNDVIQRQREHEWVKIGREIDKKGTVENGDNVNILESDFYDAYESLGRLSTISKAYEYGDMELMDTILPLENESLVDTIEKVLNNFKSDGDINDYKTIVNKHRKKTGIPCDRHPQGGIKTAFDYIYLYDGKTCYPFDESAILKPRIDSIKSNTPWIYVYFVPPEETRNVEKIGKKIMDKLVESIGHSIKERFCELFPNAKIS